MTHQNSLAHAHSSVCVYLGARFGDNPAYRNAVSTLARLLAEQKIDIVYGGTSTGLMGAFADSALAAGGVVRGILAEDITQFEAPHYLITELTVVANMHKRKKEMAHLARAFILCPGGFGSLDEFFEILVWRQLEFHKCPILVLNTEGYWDKLKDLMEWVVKSKFAASENYVQFMNTPEEILQVLEKGVFEK